MHSSKVKQARVRRDRRNFTLAFVLCLCGASFYYYYPQISFYFLSNVFLRLENHAQKIEEDILSPNVPGQDILDALGRVRDIAKLTKDDDPANPLAHYYMGLLDFYELCLRLDQGQISLLLLTGRGFLPQHKATLDIEPKSVLPLVKKVILSMRRALAIKPDFLHNERAHIILSYASLLFTSRTDLRELRRIQENKLINPSPLLAIARDWLSLAFYAQLGRKKELSKFITQLRDKEKQLKSKKTEQDPKTISHLRLEPAAAFLLLCHGFYQAQDYIGALKYARLVKFNSDSSEYMRVEALRMQAEIFYIQRGKAAAKAYFDLAYAASNKEDNFIKERMKEIYYEN